MPSYTVPEDTSARYNCPVRIHKIPIKKKLEKFKSQICKIKFELKYLINIKENIFFFYMLLFN